VEVSEEFYSVRLGASRRAAFERAESETGAIWDDRDKCPYCVPYSQRTKGQFVAYSTQQEPLQ